MNGFPRLSPPWEVAPPSPDVMGALGGSLDVTGQGRCTEPTFTEAEL